MACHVAILRRPYVQAVLAGRKTVESRLSRTAVEPYGCVTEGERIFIKASGGPFMATAVAGRVASFENLRPSDVATLRDHFNARVCGDDDYWRTKRDARYATFVELRAVEACAVGPGYAKSAYKAWFTLPDEASPWLEVALTAGAVRNRYVSVGGRGAYFGAEDFTLALPDGCAVATGLYRGQRVRWRGWGPYFEAHEVKAGDRVRFVAAGGGRYRVGFVKGDR
ncbi:MAG: hypothetical protein WD534_01680 [Phycisphaeraceae bacterium]